MSEFEINDRKQVTKRAVGTVRSALRKGVLPGESVAFLALKPLLERQASSIQQVWKERSRISS